MRPRGMYWPPRLLLTLQSCVFHIPDLRRNPSLLEGVIDDLDIVVLQVGPRIIDDLLVQLLLVLLQGVLMLPFEAHLHLLVRLCNN